MRGQSDAEMYPWGPTIERETSDSSKGEGEEEIQELINNQVFSNIFKHKLISPYLFKKCISIKITIKF